MSEYFMTAAVLIGHLGVKIIMTKYKYVSIEQPANARQHSNTYEPWHEISNNVVCATSKASDQSAHTKSDQSLC